jgi:mRNA interferase RelE/StbE
MWSMHSIEYTKQAVKSLAAMSSDTRTLVVSKIHALAANPTGAANVKKLVGRPGYRLRVGSWRVIYTLDSGRLLILVLDIGARGGVYK